MKTPNLFLSLSLSALLIQGAIVASPAKSDKDAGGSKPAAVLSASPVTNLKQAMAADAVRKIMGQPEEIKPMKAPNGKAEIWTYKRDIAERFNRVPIGSIPITTTSYGADGKAYVQTIGQDIKYADQRIVTIETVEILMFNDHYVTHKITRQDVKRYS